MKRLIAFCGVLMLSGSAYADIDSPVLNEPATAVDAAKTVTNVVEPGLETLYDIRLGEWRQGTSIVVWTYSREGAPLVSIRTGYAIDYLPYISAPVDLKTVTNRYVLPVLPDSIEGYLGAGPLDRAWEAVGKYGTLGPWLGINLDRHEDGNQHDGGLAFGVSVGAKLTF